MKLLIIGGVAGGATTAARLRRRDESAEIIMIERGSHISYANCGLPYYIGGTIPDRNRLFVQTPESFNRRLGVDVRTDSEVVEIDRKGKRVRIESEGESYWESYDKLVLSPGAEPIRPPLPGIDGKTIFTLRNVTDTDRIKGYIEENRPKRAVIVGGGFIGLEMAENLHNLGIFVTLVEMADQVMNILDYEMAAEVHQHLKTKQVEFYLKDAVDSFRTKNGRTTVRLKSGKELDTDMVILSIGVRPETSLAEQAGLGIGPAGGIKVDEHLLTSDPDIYSLGDAIEFVSPISGTPVKIPLAGPANKQGRIIADNIADGNTHPYTGTLGTGIAKVFDLTVASTGLAEKTLDTMGVPHRSVITHSGSHAGYYPGAIPLSIKTVFSPKDGKLLGAQIVGYTGVDKRIDVIAAVMGAGGTVYDLEEVEHAYAPPYSSAKDPVNIAGFVAGNVLTGISDHLHWHEVAGEDHTKSGPLTGTDRFFLLDVRTPDECSLGSIDGAVNIPVDDLRGRLGEIPQGREIVVFCGVGQRAYIAERILKQNGFECVKNLSGGYKTYSMAIRKQSNEDIFEGDFIGKDDTIYQADVEHRGRN
jgi:NADPH-dependent 2,4-dienoyl-CoA reductase/sulfur reductase-like enzyme/rhodanese-related sulfurtransferase